MITFSNRSVWAPVSDKQWSFGRLWPSDNDDQCIQIIEVPCAQCTPCKAGVPFWSSSGIEPMTLVQWATHSTNVWFVCSDNDDNDDDSDVGDDDDCLKMFTKPTGDLKSERLCPHQL